MRTPLHRGRIGAAPAILILLATSCDSAIVDPGPVDQSLGVPDWPEDAADPGGGTASAVPRSRMAFGMCLEWGWDASFNDVCTVGGIVIRDVGGSETRVLAADDFYPDDPAWSPDGSKIAFTAYPHCDAAPCTRDIYVMNADGSSLTRLTTSADAGGAEPAWTPDGLRIAYVGLTHSTGTFTHRLRVMNADGSGSATLGNLLGSNPAWSPDGTQLAFAAPGDGSWRIHVADADGSNARALTGEPDANDYRPSWSPDGQRIAFTRSWRHADGSGSCEVFVMDTDGSNLTQLTDDSFCAHDAAWSPDGAMIAYNGIQSEGDLGLKLVHADGHGASLLRRTYGWPSRVAWEPMP